MSTRITDCFAKAKAEGRGAFVAYFTTGYPTMAQSEAAIDQAIAGGADIVELGVPFSDPFADGGVIRSAAYEALKQGVCLDDVLAVASAVSGCFARMRFAAASTSSSVTPFSRAL